MSELGQKQTSDCMVQNVRFTSESVRGKPHFPFRANLLV